MWTWNCTCIHKCPSYRFSSLAKQINCMKILRFIATMLMTSNKQQTLFWIIAPPPSPHTRTRARSQWRQRLSLLHSLALREGHVNVAIKRQFCKPWSDCSFGSRLRRVYADWSDLSFQITSQIEHTQKTSTPLKYFSINSNTPCL